MDALSRPRFHSPTYPRVGTLPPRSRFQADGFAAEDYDRLVDSPVEIGAFQESDFDEGGGHYRVVVDADPSDYDMHKIVAMLRRLVSSATIWMEDRPFQTYVFFYHFPRDAPGNGMEHANGTAIDLSAQTLSAQSDSPSQPYRLTNSFICGT